MFVLVEHEVWGVEYYTGKTYMVQGEIYPCVVGYSNKEQAKVYTSRKRAENACKKLNFKVGRDFQVEPLK